MTLDYDSLFSHHRQCLYQGVSRFSIFFSKFKNHYSLIHDKFAAHELISRSLNTYYVLVDFNAFNATS